jgi:DNA-binding NarL/FixJ family response regulator
MKQRKPNAVRVFLVDDHPIVRRGFQLLLGMEPDLEVCGDADNAPEALASILQMQPDVAIVDLSLRASSGMDLVKQLRTQCPKIKILVFTMKAEQLYAERALRAGANGYMTKEEGAEKAISAVRELMQGKTYLSPQLTASIMSRLSYGRDERRSIDLLSDRELEILELIGNGLASRQIADQLRLSIKTVESHREHIKLKLGLKRANELTQFAFNWTNRPQDLGGERPQR